MYNKTNWVNQITPVNAENLNKIENGIYQNALDITTIQNMITTINTALGNKPNKSQIYNLDYLNYRLDRAENYQKADGSTVTNDNQRIELSGEFGSLLISDGSQGIATGWSCTADQIIVLDNTSTAKRYSKSGQVEELTYAVYHGLSNTAYSFIDELGGTVNYQLYDLRN